MRGFDISNYQSQFSLADAQSAKAEGYNFVMIGRQANNVWATQQAQYCREAGIEHILEYLISLNGVWPALFTDSKYVIIDVEEGSEFVTEDQIDNAILFVLQSSKIPLIYSNSYQWDRLGLGGVTKYAESGIPLVNANYTHMPNGSSLRYPFGGWTSCDIDQYTDKGYIYGIDYVLDLDEANDSMFTSSVFQVPEATPEPIPNAVPSTERELNSGERIAFLNTYASQIVAFSSTHVYQDDSSPTHIVFRIEIPRD